MSSIKNGSGKRDSHREKPTHSAATASTPRGSSSSQQAGEEERHSILQEGANGRRDSISHDPASAQIRRDRGEPSLSPSEVVSANIKKMMMHHKSLPLTTPKESIRTVARRYVSAGFSKFLPQREKTIDPGILYQHFVEQDALRARQLPTKGKGLTTLRVSGSLLLRPALMKELAEAFPGKEKISISEITPKVAENLVATNKHHEVIGLLSLSSPCTVFMRNEDGVESKRSLRQSSHRPVKTRDMTGIGIKPEKIEIRSKASMVKVTPALAIALACLAVHDFQTCAKIIAVNPHKLLGEVDRLFFAGNIFSEDAFLALLRELAPSDQRNILLAEEAKSAADGIALAVNHYYRFPPQKGLLRHIPVLVRSARKAEKNEDLLIQNHFRFLAEVGTLVSRIINEGNESCSNSVRAERAAAQAALLIGNTFNYAVRFSGDLSRSEQKVAGQVAAVGDLVKGAVGIAGSSIPASSAVTEAGTLATDLISKMVQSWALRTDQELNIEETAKQLARLSDGLKERSKYGLLVPGKPEWTVQQWEQSLANGAAGLQERDERKFLGKSFEKNYSQHLQNFMQHYLERTLREAGKES